MSQLASDLAVFEASLGNFPATAALPAHMAALANALIARAKAADSDSDVLAAINDFDDNGTVVLRATAGSMLAVVAQCRQETSRYDH